MDHSPKWSFGTAVRPVVSISTAFGYIFTLSAPSHFCLLNFTVIISFSIDYFRYMYNLFPDDHLNDVFGHGVLIWLFHMVHVVLLRQDDGYITSKTTDRNKHHTKTSIPRASSCTGSYLKAYKMLYNYRGIGTTWKVVGSSARRPAPRQNDTSSRGHQSSEKRSPSNLDLQSQQLEAASSFPQSKVSFVQQQLVSILLRYLALSFLYELLDSVLVWGSFRLIGWLSFSGIHAEETVIRILQTTLFMFHDWLVLSCLHECLSLVFVCILRLDEPHEWPRLFGSIIEAYTIRRFWANFWHKLAYAPLRASASVLSTRLRSRSMPTRLVDNALVFFLSGILHSLMDWRREYCDYWSSAFFYWIQPAGLVLEGVVQYFWTSLRTKKLFQSTVFLLVFERIAGYLWVWCWFFWLVPQRKIAQMSCSV